MPATRELIITTPSAYETELAGLAAIGQSRYLQHIANIIVMQGVRTIAVQNSPILASNIFTHFLDTTATKLDVQRLPSEEAVIESVLGSDDMSIATPVRTGVLLPRCVQPINTYCEDAIQQAIDEGRVHAVIEDVRVPSNISPGAQSLMSLMVAG